MKIIITGFGPFGPFKFNPSRVIAKEAVEILVKQKIDAEFVDLIASIKDIHKFYDNLHEDNVFVLHLGLYNGLHKLNIEDTGKNTAEFVIPDAEGEQPRFKKIDQQQSIDFTLHSSLPCGQWADELSDNFDLSHDAGTYVCNYCYYTALSNVNKKTKGTLFVHCGDFDDISEEKQVNAIVELVSLIFSHFK